MSTEISRIGIQRNEDNSAVKQFLQDQLGVLLTIVGGVPIIFEYFGLIDKPHTLSEFALRAISITSLLISVMLILFIYGERRHLVRERRTYAIILGILFMFAGLALLAVYVYEPVYDKLKFKTRLPNGDIIFFYSPQSEPIKPPIPQNVDSPFSLAFGTYVVLLLGICMWVIVVARLIYLINKRTIEKNLQLPAIQSKWTVNYKKMSWQLRLLVWLCFIKRTDLKDSFLASPVKAQHSFFSNLIKVILICYGIVLLLYAINVPIQIYYPTRWLIFFEMPASVPISFRKLNILKTGMYILYYPFLVTGIVLMATVVFSSFERKNNFYQNINQLSEHFYKEVELMVVSLVQFEKWFDRREIAYREGRLSGKRTRITDENKSNEPELDDLDPDMVAESQRLFLWQVMRAKAEYYRKRIDEFAVPKNRLLNVSGGLIDDIFADYMPRGNNGIKSFMAVSSGDIHFWKKRGEEYLAWNSTMIKDGVEVTRIFLIKSGHYFKGVDLNDTTANFSVLFDQVRRGIQVYLCYEDAFVANDGSYFDQDRKDFGIYPDFAVSFFGKPLRIGGRSLKMAFDDDVIKDYSDHYFKILRACDNKAYVDDKQISLLVRCNQLENYLLHEWWPATIFADSRDKRDAKAAIKKAAEDTRRFINEATKQTKSTANAATNNKPFWRWLQHTFRR